MYLGMFYKQRCDWIIVCEKSFEMVNVITHGLEQYRIHEEKKLSANARKFMYWKDTALSIVSNTKA